MSYQFCYMVQALGKSQNQLPLNFKSLWTVASEAFFTFIGPILYLIWICWKWRLRSRLMWSLKDINGAGLGIPDESSVTRSAMQWNPLDGIGRKKGTPCETWRRIVKRECKNLYKTWPDLNQLAQSRVQFGGELALLMPYVPVGIKDTKKIIDYKRTSWRNIAYK